MACTTNTALTDSELNQTFGNGVVQGLLPSTANPSSDRDGNGMLSSTTLNRILSNLKSTGIVPVATTTNSDAFFQKQSQLLQNILAEYCFYDSRYKYSLQKLLSAIQQGYISNTGDTQTAIKKYLGTTQTLNQRLNDLIQIINIVTDDMLQTSNNLESEIQALNKQLSEQKTKLDAQNNILSSNQAATKLNKQMVRFTEEKAKYTDNLLKLYTVLNIVAFGLLIYVYKSSP